jgi:hypothetical protein
VIQECIEYSADKPAGRRVGQGCVPDGVQLYHLPLYVAACRSYVTPAASSGGHLSVSVLPASCSLQSKACHKQLSLHWMLPPMLHLPSSRFVPPLLCCTPDTPCCLLMPLLLLLYRAAALVQELLHNKTQSTSSRTRMLLMIRSSAVCLLNTISTALSSSSGPDALPGHANGADSPHRRVHKVRREGGGGGGGHSVCGCGCGWVGGLGAG